MNQSWDRQCGKFVFADMHITGTADLTTLSLAGMFGSLAPDGVGDNRQPARRVKGHEVEIWSTGDPVGRHPGPDITQQNQ